MKLVFVNRRGKEKKLGIFDTIEQAEKRIQQFLEEKHYDAPYWRVVHFDTKYTYDVGSWSEFFVLYFDDKAKSVGVWDEA